ncbi:MULTISPECIES: hypothetical protein [unclassified Roseateles]|uniref:hypothetical protein n=1 Tax=unclassified Roseateles TaxID=2626991 RepID=UPI0006F3C23D|nr:MULTISPECIES: hypothetical protein [unclassified Roseateles]KQW46204.1 hypothetical protein ASC81_07240 [Pelomonas sp. Root405]KRA73253.1 hypothetical protein ASD88_07240 [Pelomonas sp. Root662]
MNAWLVAAAALVFLTGLVHSWMGEVRIFRHLRRGGIVPTCGEPALRDYQTRIVWASWHLVTIGGWAQAALLMWLAQPVNRAASAGLIEAILAAALAAGAGLVLWSNRGRHLGWVALLLAAAFVLMSSR